VKEVSNMKTIKIGKVNDEKVFASEINEFGKSELIPFTEKDIGFAAPDYCILCDSGVYPSVIDVDSYVCEIAEQKINN
jgi:hypothetical protein